jgi:hypothetical protein
MTQALCTSFKLEMLKAQHNFAASGGHTFKIALAKAGIVLNAGTTNYSQLGVYEVGNAGTYAAGGLILTNVDPSADGTTGMVTFSGNPQWTGVTITDCTQALIYNSSQSGKAVAVLDFGGNQAVTAGTFTINLPSATATTALLRFI